MKSKLSSSMRFFQDQFETRRLADRVLEKAFHNTLTSDDHAFVENAMFFFMASTDAESQPQCCYKGGARGFVKVTTDSEIAFPLYGNFSITRGTGTFAHEL